ncbi:hypothetical protein [Algihabitans albus]|uniref:hypothetical protein n=1 Tax=Algihabitans albus TaxID=2164067 RepID=UPI000E5D3308|nr:hypothetical protein [Algihabitans albus]
MSKIPKHEHSRTGRRIETRGYRIDKRKVVFAILLLLAFVVFGTWTLMQAETPTGDTLVGGVLMVFCLGMASFLARDLKRAGTVVEVGPEGVLDLRTQEGLIRWDRIAGAEIKRASIVRGIRLTLEDGKRVDIDTQMLEVDRKELMRVIAEEGRRAEERRAR